MTEVEAQLHKFVLDLEDRRKYYSKAGNEDLANEIDRVIYIIQSIIGGR